MSSAVIRRRPKSVGSGTTPRGSLGRPKSWTEFNSRFQEFSNPVNIDISPVSQPEETKDVKRRNPSSYRKVRPLSASILDSYNEKYPQGPSSPNYTSLLTPNPWRHNGSKQSPLKVVENEQLKRHYEPTSLDYDVTKNAKTREENTPEAKFEHENSESSDAELKQIAFSSDSDSIDSAVVVSGECTPYATSSEKSPRWRNSDRDVSRNVQSTFREIDSGSLTGPRLERPSKTDHNIDEENRSTPASTATSSSSTPPPEIVISTVASMEFFPDEDVIRFEESPIANFDRRTIVPSPLKSCYSPVATYDDLVEYSDFENSSGEENSTPELSRHSNNSLHGYDEKQVANNDVTPDSKQRTSQLRVYQFPDDVTNDNVKNDRDVTKRSSTKRRGTPAKKTEDDIDFDAIMKNFKKSKEEHLKSLKWIYADSNKKVLDLLEKLKETMTENGYLEWYPRVR